MENNKNTSQNLRESPGEKKKFFWVLLVFVLVVGIWIGVQGANQGVLTLATSAQGLTDKDGNIKVRVRAIDAANMKESLYTIDQTAVVKDGQLKLRWQIPPTAKKKAAYIEICAMDKRAGPSATVKKSCIEQSGDVAYNKVSCPYYVPANSTGFSGQLNGWNKLDDSQKVGCSGDRSFSKASSLQALAEAQSPGIQIDGGGVLVAENGKIETKDVEQFVQDALANSGGTVVHVTTNEPTAGPQGPAGANGTNGTNGTNGADGAAGIATVSGGGLILTGQNLSLDDSCLGGQILQWDGANWVCASVAGTDSQTLSLAANVLAISGGNSVNLSGYLDNTDSQALSWNGGTRTLSLTSGGSVVISDTDTTYGAGNGLSLGGTTFSINSPTCAGTTKLTWNGTVFSCAADVDTDTDTTNFNVAANGGAGQNISSGGTVNFTNGTGTTANRSGSDISFGLANTAVTGGTYSASNNANGSLALPQFTVDAQGRLTAASTSNVTLTGIANSQLANSAITVNTAGPLAGGGSVSLGGSLNLSLDLSDAGDGATATTSSGSGLEISGNEVGLLRGCSSSQLLKWNSGSLRWECASDTDTDTNSGGTVTSITAGTGLSGGAITTSGTINIANTGVTAASYGSSTSIPVITVNAQGQITAASSSAIPTATTSTTGLLTDTDWDTFNGKENVLTFNGNGLFSRSGNTVTGLACSAGEIPKWTAGSFVCGTDNNSGTSYSAGNGLSLGGTTFSINSPTCAGTDKLTWSGTAFSCAADVDTDTDTTNFNVAAAGTGGSQNITSGGTVTFGNGTGTTATRSGSTVTYGLNNTAVSAGTYTASDNANGSLALPQFTVDAQGRLAAASTTNVTLTGIANAQLANSAITVNTAGGLTGGSSVSLGGSINLSLDLSDAGDSATASTNSGSGLEVSGGEIGLIRGCSNTQLLKWNSSSLRWECASDTDTNSGGTVTSVTAGTGLSGGTITSTGTIDIANTGVTAASYGSSTSIPVITVNAQGQITAASSSAIPTATTSTTGLLTDTDWDTFNGKENVLTFNGNGLFSRSGNTVTGLACIAGEIPKWTAGAFACGADAGGASYSAGNGLSLGGSTFSINSPTCAGTDKLQWTGTAFICSADVDTDTGVTSIGTIDSQTKSANGAVISGTSLVLQTADGSNPGLVSTTTQTFAGAKTFSGSVNANGDVTLGDAAADGITITGEIRGASPLAFEGATNDGVYTTFAITDPTVARTITFPDASGTVCLQGSSSCGFISVTLNDGQILVGNGSNVATAVTPSGDVTISNSGVTTIGANSVALGTDTTGNYVAGNTAGNGISVSGSAGEGWSPTIAINSPTCAGTDKLTWNGSAFSCASDVDTDTDTTNFNVAAQGTVGSQNITSGDTVTFNNGTGTTATRSGSTVTYGLNNTAVSAGTYSPSDNANGSLALPQFTVDAQGRLTAASTTNVTLTGIANSQLTNSAITVNTAGGLTGGSSVSLGGSINLSLDLSDSGDSATATTNSGSGLEVSGGEIGLIRGCSSNQLLKWNSISLRWECASDTDTDTDTGVTSVGTIDSQTKSANGAVISGTVVYLQTADASAPGLVSTGTQTFAGNKTFNGNVIADANLTANGDVTLGNAAADAITFTGEVRGASPLAFEGATNDGVYTTFAITDPTLARTVTFPDRSGTVSLSGDTFTGDVTGTLNASGATTLTIASNSVALGTDTTGDYVTNVTAGGGLTGTATGEGSTPTLAIVSSNGGIVVNADDIALTIAASANGLSSTTSSGSGLEVLSSGLTLLQGCSNSQILKWNETTDVWECAADVDTDTDTGVTSVGTIDSQTKSANGAVISGTVVYLQTADATAPGLVSTGTQTFAGDKTFNGNVITGGNLTANGDVTLGNAATDAITFTGEVRGASPLAFEGATNDGVYTTFAITDPTVARTVTFPDRSGTVSLSGDTFTGDVTGTLSSSGATALTIAANSVALGTDTTGNYVADVAAGTGLSVSGTPGEGWTPTVSLANTAVSAGTYTPADNANGSIAVPQFTVDAQGRLTAASTTNITPTGIANAQLANSSLTVTAGAGLANGGSVSLGGSVALDIGAGNGITVNANDITIDLTAATDALSANTSSSSGLEVLGTGLTLLQGCSNSQILKWNETTDVWECAADVDTDTGVTTIGTIDSQTKSANGAVISGTSLVLQTADASNPGLVSTGTQTFAGNKTFSGNTVLSGTLNANGDVTLGDAATDGLTFTGEIRGASPLVFEGATNDNVYTTFAITDPTGTRTVTFADRSGTVSLSGDTFTGDVTGTLNSTGATALTIAANSVALGTDTTGDYVTNVTAGGGLTGTATGEGSTPTLAIVSSNGGIVVNADDIALTIAASANGLSSTTSSGSGLEVLSSGLTLLQGCSNSQLLKWNETTDVWECAADVDTDTDTGVTSIGTIDSQTKSANGAVISGSVIYFQTADASNVGLVSTGTQTFAGNKTFNGNVIADANLTVNGDVTLGNAATDGLTFTGEVRGASPLAFEGVTNDGVYTTFAITDPTSARTITFPDRSGTVSLSGDTFTGDVTGTLNSSGATALTIAANSVALGTDTTGDYVTNVTAGGGLTGTATGEGSTPTLAIVSSNGGIVVNADDIALTIAASANGLSSTTSSGSGLEILASGITLLQGCSDTQILKWNETTDVWACAADTDTDTGVTSIGTIDSQTKSANGAVISGSVIYLQTADASSVGLVSTGTQTFAGDKTFNGNVIADANLTVNGDVVLGNAASDAITFTGEVRGASPLAFEGATNDGVYTTFAITDPTLARTITFPDRSGTVSLSGDTFTGDVTGTLNSSGATALTIAANSVALGTDTTGDYVAGNTAGNGIAITGSTGEGWSPTVSINAPTCAGTDKLQWNGTAFVCTADVDTDTGVTTVGAFSGSSIANGASISGTTITFGPADGTNPGMVTTGAQTLAGAKTFTSGTTVRLNSATAFVVEDSSNNNVLTVSTNTGNKTVTVGAGGIDSTFYVVDTSSNAVFGISTVFSDLFSTLDTYTFADSGGVTMISADGSTGNVGIGLDVGLANYKLDVAGDINTSGIYRVGGVAGANTTCSGGQVLQNLVATGGIVTAGTCAADAGVTSIGTIDSQTKSANGAVISGTSLVLQTADASMPGLVSTGTQTFAGDKTLTGLLTANGGLTIQAGDTFTMNGDAFTDLTGSGLAISGGALVVDDSTSSGFFRNGGNTFGAAGTLGTNDANVLNIETNGTDRFQISSSASTLTGQGTTILTSTGTMTLSSAAASDLNITSGNNVSVVSNDTTVLSQNDSATAFQVQNSLTSPLFNVDASTASTTVYSPYDSATAFQVQNSVAGLLFNVDASTGTTTIASGGSSGSTTNLQVLNGTGDQVMNVNTTNIVNNLITNPSFEVDDSGWSASTYGNVDTTQSYIGKSSYVVNAQSAGGGATYDVALASDTSYTLSFYAKVGADEYRSTLTTMYAGYYDGTSNNNCIASQTVSSSGWTRYSCAFTTGTTSGTPNIYIRQNDSTQRNIYIDGVQLLDNTLPSNVITGTDSTFESGIGTWSGYSSGAVTQSSAQAHMGTYSGRMITTGGGNENGITYGYSGFSALTTYTIKAYIKADAASASATYQLGHVTDNGQVSTVSDGCNIVTPTSSTWKVLTCTFTTAPVLRANPYITITQKSNLSTSTTTYVDSISMYAGTDVYGTDQGFTMGRISLNGAIESPTLFQNASNSTTAFQIQGANSSNALLVADTLNNRVAIGKNTAAYTLDVEGIINASSSVITPSLTSLAGTALSVDSGTTGALNIGTGANAKTITIGNATGATSVVVNCGTGACSFGANATAHTTTLGSATGAANTIVQAGTGGLTLGSSGVANTIQIGNTTGAVSQTINIGNNATASSTSNVNIGSTVAGTTAIAGPTTITGRTSGSSSTLIVNNSTSTGAIFTAQDNGTAVLTIANNGGATFKTVTNTANAFKTTNSNNDVLFSVGTAQGISDYTNIINNSSFESGSAGWTGKSGGSMGSGSGGGSVTGIGYMTIGMDAVGEGAYYPVTLAANTDYTLSVYARTYWGAMNTLVMGHQDQFGSDIDDCVLSSETIDTDWHRVSCTFTTGSTISSSNVYIRQSDATNRSVEFDAVQLQASPALSAYNMGEVYFNAPINQNLIVTANGYSGINDLTFQVQDSTGALQFGVSAAGQVTVANGLAVNGGEFTSTATTFNFLQTDVTELNIGGAVGSSGINLAGGSGSTGCTIQGAVGSLTCSGNIVSTATSGIQGWWSRTGTTLQPNNSGDNITTTGNISTTSTGSITSAGGLQVDGNTVLGDAATDTIMTKGSMIANAAATGTTDTTSGTGTNTTTVTISGTSFANGDVILIDNAGQDYYTRVTAGGGSSSLTVSPAVTFETGRTVTKYNVQNIGATDSNYTTQSNRFFQGYFLGGVVTGAGSTTLSDGRLASTVGLNFDAPSYTFTNTSDSTSAFRVNRADGENLVKFDTLTTENLLTNGQFETNTTGWTAKGAAGSPTQNTSQHYLGGASMQVITTNAANDGVKYNYALASQTNYTMTFYAKTATLTGATSTINIGRTEDGSTDSDCATGQTINGGGWTKLTCIFTTGNVSGTNNIYLKQSDASGRTIYIDSVELQTSANLVTNPDVETDITGWSTYNGPSISQTTSQSYTGSASIQVDTSGTIASEGPVVNPTTQPNTTYSVSMWVMLDAGTAGSKTASMFKRFDSNDTTTTSCGSASLSPGVWTNISCTFTTGNITSGSPYVGPVINDSGVPLTFYVDTANVSVAKWNSNDIGRISLNGAIDSPLTVRGAQDSTSALQVQQQNGNNILTVDTLNGRVGIGTAAPNRSLEVDGKALIRATSTDTDTFQVTNTSAVGTANSVAFNVAGSSRAVSVGLGSNTVNASLSVYGTSLINTKVNNANAFRITDQNGVGALTFSTTSGNRKLLIGGTGAGNDGKLTVANSGGNAVLDLDSSGTGLAYFSADDFQVLGYTSGVPLIAADGVNGFVGIGGYGAAYTLDVFGDANVQSGSVYRIAGVAGASTTCSGGQFLQDQAAVGGLTTGGTCANAVTTVGAFGGSIANGASISGNTITFGAADATNPGMVSTTTQSLAGNKTFTGNLTTNGAFQVDGNTTLGNATTDTTTSNGSIVANTATAGISSGSAVGSQTYNTDTLTVSSALFNNGDIIQVTNSGGTVFFTRVTAGGGTTTLTVSPRVNIDTTFTVTTFNSQNIGATPSNYTSAANRFYQASFLGGVSIDGGNGNTLLSNGQLYSSDAFYFNSGSYVFKNNANSTSAFQVQDSSGITLLGVDSTNKRIFSTIANGVSAVGFTFNTPNYTTSGAKLISILNNGTEKMYVDKDGNLGIATGGAYVAGASIGTGLTCSGGQILQNQVVVGGITTGGSCVSGGAGVNTVGAFSGSSQTNGANITGTTITFGPADASNPGMVSTTTQTFAGAKTLTSALTINTSAVDTGLTMTGNVNSFYQMNIQNTNSGSSSSSDFVATADNGTSTTNYVDFGINGSAGGAAPFTGANDAYLYASDSNNLHIGALGSSGAVKFYTTGGTGAPSLKLTLDSLGALTQAASSSTTTAFTLTANSLTSGNGLAISSSSTGLTGNAFSVTSASTAAVTNGIVRYNFTGAHTGNGIQVDDATTTGTVYQINASALTTGTAFQITGPSAANLIRVKNDATQGFNQAQLIVGAGDANNPDSLARDQLYVFGRINSSWNQLWADCLANAGTVTAAGSTMYGGAFNRSATAQMTHAGTVAGVSGVCRMSFATPAANATGYFGSNALVTQRSLNPVMEARVLNDNNTDHRSFIGFSDITQTTSVTTDTNQSANEAFFRKQAAGTQWEAVTRTASGTEQVTTTVGTTNGWHRFRVEMDDTKAEVRFYVDGTLVATHTTIPTTSAALGFAIMNNVTSTTSRNLDIDYMRVWSDDPPASVAPDGITSDDGVDTTNQTEAAQETDQTPTEDSSNDALLTRIKNLEADVDDLKQYKDVLTTETLGDASTKKAVFIADTEFRKQVEFSADALFKANINVDGTLNANGRVVVSNNTGTITVQPGQTEVQVLFAKPLVGKPNVFLSTENPDVKVVAQTRTKDGFVIKLSQPITDAVDVQWFAVEKQ